MPEAVCAGTLIKRTSIGGCAPDGERPPIQLEDDLGRLAGPLYIRSLQIFVSLLSALLRPDLLIPSRNSPAFNSHIPCNFKRLYCLYHLCVFKISHSEQINILFFLHFNIRKKTFLPYLRGIAPKLADLINPKLA